MNVEEVHAALHIERNCSMRPHIEYGFDRIKFWLDANEFPGDLTRLSPHCQGAEFACQQMPFNARWKSSLELFQPTIECLEVLKAEIGQTTQVQLSYTEIVIDLIPRSKKAGLSNFWCDQFLQAAVPKHHRNKAILHKGTWYFNRLAHSDTSRRSKHVLAIYCDRPSKINNSKWAKAPNCLHIEFRISSMEALSQIGLWTIDDLINFSHATFWGQHVHLYALPNKTNLGRTLAQIAGSDSNVTGEALRRRADRWVRQYSENTTQGHEQFVLFNALRETNKRAFSRYRVTFKQWLRQTLNQSHHQGM